MTNLNFTQPPAFPALEEEVLAFWQQDQTFQKSVDQRPADKPYVFYDGPPFATGLPHYGHLLASTTKDVIPRYWTMKGYRVERVWGWDCHGLPIENMIEKQLGIKGGKKGIEELGIATFNQACRAEVLRLDTEWEKIIGRLGRWVDFQNNYKTMDLTFMESVWWAFKQLQEKDLLYEGRKVILYCPRCATPLSNFEIAMDNSYLEVVEPATTYKYPVVGQTKTFLLAWSTTPWNKLATPALAVNPELSYVKVKQGDEFYILAESTLNIVGPEPDHHIVERYQGQDLTQWQFELHYDFYPNRTTDEKVGMIVADDFVTAQEGTGVVTLAIYGEDDYRVMKQHGIQLVEHVDDQGKLKPEVTPWAGLSILDANPLVDEDLQQRGLIYRQDPHTHSVATCYRCSTRLYYAPLPAWFINIEKLRPELLAQNQHINWYPDHLKHGRFQKGLENAPDWNISRSRYWGTPMPVWRSVVTARGEQPRTWTRIIGSRAELVEWAVEPDQAVAVTDLHREYLDDLEVWVDDARTIKGRRVPEVFDCWVESGSVPFAAEHYPFENETVFQQRFPAQFISEYIAQTRAWFYTMHVMSTALFGKPAFQNALTTGTILAEDGTKMSKSKKNYPDPLEVIHKYGSDSLRLYLMSSPVMKAENLNFSEKDVADIRKNVFVIWWNMLRFYQQFAVKPTDITKLPDHLDHVMDQWLAARLSSVLQKVTACYEDYDVVSTSRHLMTFVNELSTWYLRLSRERLKQDPTGQTGALFGHTLYRLSQVFAPLCPFFSEVVYQHLTHSQDSVHLSDWPDLATYQPHQNQELLTGMLEVQKVVESGRALRQERGVALKQPLAAVLISQALSADLQSIIAQELNVKTVTVDPAGTLDFDWQLTPQLRAEGEARTLMRQIQQLRKQASLQAGQPAVATVPSWPTEWQAEIEAKTAVTLRQGDELHVEPA